MSGENEVELAFIEEEMNQTMQQEIMDTSEFSLSDVRAFWDESCEVYICYHPLKMGKADNLCKLVHLRCTRNTMYFWTWNLTYKK